MDLLEKTIAENIVGVVIMAKPNKNRVVAITTGLYTMDYGHQKISALRTSSKRFCSLLEAYRKFILGLRLTL